VVLWPACAENHPPNRVEDKDQAKKVSDQLTKVRERLMVDDLDANPQNVVTWDKLAEHIRRPR
jgi:hypothetical protein